MLKKESKNSLLNGTNDEVLFKKLVQQPKIAWPTVALFGASFAVYGVSTYLGARGKIPKAMSMALNSAAVFSLFTVFHDAAHNALSTHKPLNDWLGRLSIVPLAPLPVFKAFRYIHMQHHRFANESREKDPDAWCAEGPTWMLPVRWATVDLNYYAWYLPKVMQRPKAERNETLAVLAVSVVAWLLVLRGPYAREFLQFAVLPSRIALFFLALAFDFLPHWPYKTTQVEDKYRATNIRVGAERILTPLLLSQNYHLVHHLYPLVPFYRYRKVWKAREAMHLENNALVLSVFGKELTQQEYLERHSA